jgi:outer membrane protein assembly factor BamD (BamD/ComL family)
MRAVCFFEATPGHYGLDQSELETAIQQFEDFIIDFPESEVVEDARKYLLVARTRLAHKYYDGGVVYMRIGAYEAAQIYFQKVIDDFTDTEYAAPATFEHALAGFKQGEYEQARRRFKQFQSLFPSHEKLKKAREMEIEAAFKPGEVAFKNGDYALAQEKLEAFKTEYPQHHLNGKADEYLAKIAESEAGAEHDNEDS